VDFYIASPVRAFVEIKNGMFLERRFADRLLLVLENLRQQFGDEIVPILVVLDIAATPSPILKELNAHFLIISSQGSAEDSVRQCAQQIWNHLIQLPYRFEGGIGAKHPSNKHPSKTRVKRETSDYVSDELLGMSSIVEQAWKTWEPLADEIADHSRAHAHVAKREEPYFASMPYPSVRAARPTRPGDIFFDVLVSLRSVLKPDEFEVLKQELDAFSEEYRHEHYTACGLRLGRTLEHVVYALARAWGVSVNRATLQVLSGLNNSFDQLSKTITDYATSEGEQKVRSKRWSRSNLRKFRAGL
jgi:hypothetical protein